MGKVLLHLAQFHFLMASARCNDSNKDSYPVWISVVALHLVLVSMEAVVVVVAASGVETEQHLRQQQNVVNQ